MAPSAVPIDALPAPQAKQVAPRTEDQMEEKTAAGHLTGRLPARYPALLRLRQAPGVDAVAHGRRFP